MKIGDYVVFEIHPDYPEKAIIGEIIRDRDGTIFVRDKRDGYLSYLSSLVDFACSHKILNTKLERLVWGIDE